MLKDKLMAVSKDTYRGKLCLVAETIRDMDKDTQAAFIKAVKSEATSQQIMEILKEEGITSFGITHLRDKRRECFRQETECPCMKEVNNG